MSFKTKFSLLMTLIITFGFITIVIVDEYRTNRNIREQTCAEMEKVSVMLLESLSDQRFYNKVGGGPDADFINKEIGLFMSTHPSMLEISIFQMEPRNAVEEFLPAHRLRFGTYVYRNLENDLALLTEVVRKDTFKTMRFDKDDQSIVRSYYGNKESGFVVSVVNNKHDQNQVIYQKRIQALQYAVFIYAFVMACSYVLAGLLLRPLNQILWKVKEISLGRLDSVIEVKRNDEFGLLAHKINAMSQNLTIYMGKLRKAFEDNRAMKEYLQSFIDHTSDAIHVIDLEGKIIQVNKAFEQLYGYTEEEALGDDLPLIPESNSMEMKLILDSLHSGKVLPAQETVRVTKSGETIPVSVTVSPIRDTDGEIQAFASITRDMRSRNKMEELLRHSEKLTMVGQLAAGVAHEIRNPLTTLRGFLQLQQQSQKLNVTHTALMLSELERINLIVGEFLILAKPQATRFTVKDVRFVLKDVLSLLDSEAHMYNVVFRTLFTESPCPISCEENQLKQVFINLLKNGIEAMPNGGRIHCYIGIKLDRITISITDEGIGIPEEMIPKIGSPFFTGKESGTGLGMMISQRIIHSHHGLMEIQSQVNVGTTITITLPALNVNGNEGILEKKDQTG
ncbi:PAS domain S-box protein [Paenibacillus sp. NPDC058071]|uniref:PAS domain S-box protein n=1 Tax=Paenibacillus sp. NPDC058071 TaxID=3346326 RepID=UPI0036D9B231